MSHNIYREKEREIVCLRVCVRVRECERGRGRNKENKIEKTKNCDIYFIFNEDFQ